MYWFHKDVHPDRFGDYLGCGQAIEWNLDINAPPDFYFITNWDGERWRHQETYGREFFMQYWTYLPIKPNQ